jgi:hypothetical protein
MQLQTEHNKANHSGASAAAAPKSTGSRGEETTRNHSGPQQLASNASIRELSPLRSSPAEAILATSLSPVPPPLLSHTSSSMMPTRTSPDSSGHGGTRPLSAGKERSASRGGGSGTVGSAAPVTATEAADADHEQEQQLELAIARLTEQHLARTSPRRRYSSPSLTAVASTASAGPAAITPAAVPLSGSPLSSSKLLRRNSDMFVAESHAENTPGDVWDGAPPSPAAETYTQRVFGGHKYSYPSSTEKSAPTSADPVTTTGASLKLRGGDRMHS